MCTFNTKDINLNILQQFVQKVIEILVKTFHKVRVDDDGVVVNYIQFRDVLFVLVFEYERVGADDGKILYQILFMFNTFAQLLGNLVIEVVVLVVYPFLNDHSGYLLVVIVECHKLACLLVDTSVDVCKNGSLLGRRKLVCHLLDGTLDLLDLLL